MARDCGRRCDMQKAPWFVVEADDKQAIQREFAQGGKVSDESGRGLTLLRSDAR